MSIAIFIINSGFPNNIATRTQLLRRLTIYTDGLVTSNVYSDINSSFLVLCFRLSFSLANARDACFARCPLSLQVRPFTLQHSFFNSFQSAEVDPSGVFTSDMCRLIQLCAVCMKWFVDTSLCNAPYPSSAFVRLSAGLESPNIHTASETSCRL